MRITSLYENERNKSQPSDQNKWSRLKATPSGLKCKKLFTF